MKRAETNPLAERGMHIGEFHMTVKNKKKTHEG